jgi:hypothetical protein
VRSRGCEVVVLVTGVDDLENNVGAAVDDERPGLTSKSVRSTSVVTLHRDPVFVGESAEQVAARRLKSLGCRLRGCRKSASVEEWRRRSLVRLHGGWCHALEPPSGALSS